MKSTAYVILKIAFSFTAIAISMFIVFTQPANSGVGTVIEKLSSGRQILEIAQTPQSSAPGKIFYIKIKNKADKLKIYTSAHISSLKGDNRDKISGYSIRDFSGLKKAGFLISGGYLSSYDPPASLGFLLVNNKVMRRRHDSWLLDSYLCSDKNGRPGILASSDSSQIDVSMWSFCIQAGPMILNDGHPHLKNPDTYTVGKQALIKSTSNHSFICKSFSKDYYIGITDKLNMEDLATALKSEEFGKNGDNIGCDLAIRIGGGSVAGALGDRSLFNIDQVLPYILAVE